MKVLIATPYFFPKIGGMENYAYYLAQRLQARDDFEVVVITSNHQEKKYVHEMIGELPVHRLPVWIKVSNTPINPLWYFKIRRIIAQEKPDIINVHAPVPFMADIVSAAAGNIPVVATYHAGSMLKGAWPVDAVIYVYEKIFLQLLFRRATCIVAVSKNFLEHAWSKRFQNKTVLIRPGVDTARFAPTPLPDKKTVMFVGRVEHSSSWKGQEELLQAMTLVVKNHPEVTLEIVGGGDAVAHYAARAHALGIANNVIMRGPQQGEALVDAYKRASVVVLPSTSEAEQSSVVLIEAMASGRPVIGTRIGGTPYIIDHEQNGLLVTPGDPSELAEAIERIVADNAYATALAEQAVLSAQQVDWDMQLQKYISLFSSLVESVESKKERREKESGRKKYKLETLAYITAWLGLFAVRALTSFDPFYILSLAGFGFLIVVPGFLTLKALRLTDIAYGARMGFVVGFSLLELTAVGLLGNTLLPYINVARPLSLPVIFCEVTLLVLLLSVWFAKRAQEYESRVDKQPLRERFTNLLLAAVPFGFVLMSVIGALRLNNGLDNTLTFLMLVGIGLYVPLLVLASHTKKLQTYVIPLALYSLSLALLLMTSLRGWHTTGHDVQVEMYVFELTHRAGIWLIEHFPDAYNACMSITVLPTMFATLLKIPAPYVFKVLYQVIFATAPVILYASFRKYASQSIALLAAFYFIAFPTFFGDMPMLNRQEIAFVFLALMVYVAFEERIAVRLRQWLFVALGFGMILSHYSTTYTVIALLLFLHIARPFIHMLSKQKWFERLFQNSALFASTDKPQFSIKVWMTVLLIAGSFFWTNIFTDTASGSVSRVIEQTLSAVLENTKQDARSASVNYSIFFWDKPDPDKAFDEYERNVVLLTRAKSPPETHYATTAYETDIHVADASAESLTILGTIAAFFGLDVPGLVYALRQVAAKLLQLLVIAGLAYAAFRSRHIARRIDLDFTILALASVCMVMLQVLLPVLSVEYGVLRAFQQSLMFLGLFIVVGSLCVAGNYKERVALVVGCIIAVLFFYTTSGVLAHVLLEPAQLHLSNTGTYYDIYYTHGSELSAAQWVDMHVPKHLQTKLQTDRSQLPALRTIEGVELWNGVHPGLIRRDAYVLLGYHTVHNRKSFVLWNSDIIMYTYPREFLDNNKDLVYSNGDVLIYK